MPYENEYACRLHSPQNYDKSRRANNERSHEGKPYHVIYGRRKSDGKWEDQSYRYPKGDWQAAEARSHCEGHDGNFEAMRAEIERAEARTEELEKGLDRSS